MEGSSVINEIKIISKKGMITAAYGAETTVRSLMQEYDLNSLLMDNRLLEKETKISDLHIGKDAKTTLYEGFAVVGGTE